MSTGNHAEKWNDRFSHKDYVYGKEPNLFFREFIDTHEPGRILLPAEGEGRNAVYAATKGWDVMAFDFSREGRNKAMKLAAEAGVTIRHELCDLDQVTVVPPSIPESSHSCRLQEASFDAIGLLFVHMPPAMRVRIHNTLIRCLKPGGFILLEAFNKRQILYSASGQADGRLGGPKEIGLLFSQEELASDFADLEILLLEEYQQLEESGIMHTGLSERIRFMGVRNGSS